MKWAGPIRSARAAGTAVSLATLVMLAALAGCGQPMDKTYVFHPDDSPVKVDTPELREAKAAAGIENCPQSDPSAVSRSDGLPEVTLPCLGGGRAVDLAGLSGTPLVINVWATYCGACRDEAPLFQQAHQLARGDVSIIGIDWQDTRPGAALSFAGDLGLTYPQLADPQAATRAPLGVTGLPMTLFVDESGRVAYVRSGPLHSLAELTSLIDTALGVHLPDAS